MENPYTKEQILRLVERRFESSKVDYKKAYPLDDREHKCDLIKDIIAMANTVAPDESLASFGFDPGYGFIIIGCEEDGTFSDITALDLDDAQFQEIVNERVEPKINFLFVPFEHEVDGQPLRFGSVIIPPSECPPYRVSKELLPLRSGYCAVRRGSSTSPKVTDAELERMFAYRTRFSEAERRLQREEFRVSEEEQRYLKYVYVEPQPKRVLLEARRILEDRHFLLIQGEMGMGKRTTALWLALALMSDRQAFRILRVSRFTPIGDLRDAEGAVIIIPDAFGLFRLERLDIEKDTGLLEELTRSNFVIMTSSTSVLSEVLRETRLEEWDLLQDAQLQLTVDSYNKSTWKTMVNRHLAWAVDQGRVRADQAGWLSDALGPSGDPNVQKAVYGLSSPLDIKRLVNDLLPQIEQLSELLPAIHDLGSLQREIRSWFYGLGDDQQCFLFTLALFDGFDRQEIWRWYKQISDKLRNLNPTLRTRPLGSMSRATEPYVTQSFSKPTFAHPSFYEAILTVVAEEYREYFLLLVPDFIKASVPTPDATENEIAKSQQVRDAISLAAGEVAQGGIGELMALIEAWASYKTGRVRLAAAEVLSRGAEGSAQLEEVLEIVYRWIGDRSHEAYGKRWTAAVALGRLSQVAPDKAIDGLGRLATDPHPFVRSGVPKALRPLVTVRPDESKRIFTDLAADSDDYTRREVSRVLRTVSYRQPDFVADLVDMWCPMESAHRIWTLVRTCLVIPRSLQQKRIGALDECVRNHPDIAGPALQDALKEGDIKPDRAWSLVEGSVEHDPATSSDLLPLAVALRDYASDMTWERLRVWSEHSSPQVRCAAAHVLVNWKTTEPEKAQVLLDQLANDPDREVAEAAHMEPLLVLLPAQIDALALTSEEPDGTMDIAERIRILDDGELTDEEIDIRILDE